MRAAFLLLTVAALRLDAQVVETPVAFDSAAKVRSLTPALVVRLELASPAWPVAGDFVEARLYSVSTGGTVLSVERSNGTIERYALTDEQISTLRGAIDSAMATRTGTMVSERPMPTPDVRGAFARNQMILSAILYGPLIASFADDGQTATALYLLSVGASFFVVNNVSKTTRVTRPQNDLATDGALRGYGAASGLLFALGGEGLDRKAYSAIGLAGTLGGSMVGFNYGRRLTDSEAQAARKVSTLTAAATLGAMGSFGAFEQRDQDRFAVGAMVAGGAAGYLLGPTYPRRAKYTATAGDVRLLSIGALIGIGAAVTPVSGSNDNAPLLWSAATAGGLGGVALMDRTWIRRYDHGHSDATQIWLGMIAGTLLGAAVAVLAEPSQVEPVMALLTGGALLGAIAGHSIAKPELARPRGASNNVGQRSTRLGSARLHFDASGFALAAARVPGRHPLISVTF